jgi:hypothetical protein
MGHQLIGIVQVDLHLSIGGLIKGVYGWLADMLGQGRTGIGLHSPPDFFCRKPMGRPYCRGCHGCSPQSRFFDKISSFHQTCLLSFVWVNLQPKRQKYNDLMMLHKGDGFVKMIFDSIYSSLR